VDEEVIKWLQQLNVQELIKKKSAYRILNEDVLPNLKGLISGLSPEKIAHLTNCEILERHTKALLPLGRGYLYNLISNMA
ncbi:MAG: hypothetical protein R6W90_10945, partial [Ignavibacteriaceae bacterium]